MATSVDTKVVELKFNNDNFAEKVDLTREKLEQLNKDIDQLGLTQAFKNLSKSAKDVDISSISDGVEEVNKGFSKMEIFAVTAMANISNSAVNLGKKLIRNLIEPITSGGLTRAMNIEQATFQFEGMKVGKSKGNEAKSYYEEVMQAVLGTAYSYDVAAKAASQLAASNIGVEKSTKKLADGSKVESMVMNGNMTKALLGIAGVASMTGSSFDDMAQIFTRVAGQGKVMANDLNSIASRGLNAAATLANYLGKSEEEIREMVKKGLISFEIFSNAMSEAYGSHAKDSTLMFTGALEDVKAALARIGADFYGPALNGARDFLNSLTPLVDVIHEKINPYLEKTNNLLSTFALRGSQALDFISYFLTSKGKGAGGEGAMDWIYEHVNSYTNLMDYYNRNTKTVYDAIHGLYLYGLQIGDTTKKIRGFTMIANYLGTDVETVKKQVEEGTIGFNTFYKAFKKLYSESTELASIAGISETFDKYVVSFASAGEETDLFIRHIKTLGAIIENSKSLWNSFTTIAGSFASVLLTVLDHMRPLGKLLVDTAEQFAKFTVKTADYIANSKSFGAVIDSMIKILTKLFDVLRLNQILPTILSGITKAFGILSLVVEKVSQGIAVVATTVAKYFGIFLDKIREVMSDAQLLSDILNDIKTAGIVVGMIRFANYLLKPLEALEAITAAVKQTSKGIQGIFTGIGDALKSISGLFGKIGKVLDEVTYALKRMQELLVATVILEIAAAIAVLAAALYLLSKVNIESAADALLPLLGLGGLVGAFFAIMGYAAKNVKALKMFASLGTSFRDFALGIAILAAAIYAISKIDKSKLKEATAVVELLMITMGVIAKLLTGSGSKIGVDITLFGQKFFAGKDSTSSMTTGMMQIVKLAAAMYIVALALKKVSSIGSPDDMYNSLAVIEALLWTMFAMTKMLSKQKPDKMVKGIGGLISMAIAVNLLVRPLTSLSTIDKDSLWNAVVIVGVLISTMTLLLKTLSGTEGSAKAAVSLLIMAGAITILQKSLVELSMANSDDLWNSFGIMALSIAGLVTAMNLLDGKDLLVKAASLLVVAEALKVLGNIITDVGGSGDSAWTGLAVIALGLTALWVACKAFENVKLDGIGKLFLTLLSVAVVTAAFGAAIGILGIGLSLFGAGLSSIAGGIKELSNLIGPFVIIFGSFILGIGALSTVGWPAVAVIVALGAAFLMFGSGMQKMGDGMQNVAIAVKFIAGLKAELEPTAKAIVDFVKEVNKVTNDAEKIGNGLTTIAKPFASIRKSVKEVNENVKEFSDNYGTLMSNMSEYMYTLSTSLQSMTRLNANSFTTATEAVKGFVTGLTDISNDAANISSNIQGLGDTMSTLATEVQTTADAFRALEKHGITSLENLGNNIANIVSPIQTLNNLRSSFGDISNDFMNFIKSLSGLKDNASVVSQGATEIKEALDSVANAAAQAKDKFGAFTQDTANVLSMMGSAFTDIAAGVSDIVAVQGDLPSAAESIRNFYDSLSSLSELAGEISGGINAVASAVTALGNSAKRAVKTSLGDLDKTGAELINNLVKGIDKKASSVKTSLQSAVDAAHNSVKTTKNYNKWKGIGEYLIKGMIKGISSQQASLETQVKELEKKAERAVEAKAKIKSPSKVWMKIGSYMGEGLAIGIANTGDQVKAAAVSLANVSEDAVSSTILAITDAINNDMVADPVITPVVDLSNVRESSAYINSQFGRTALGLYGSPYGSFLAGAINRNIQNGSKNTVDKAIDDLTDKIAGMTETMNSRQLNVYNTIDGAADPEAFADGLLRRFKLNVRTM